VAEIGARLGEFVHFRRMDELIARISQGIKALVIRENKNDVGLLGEDKPGEKKAGQSGDQNDPRTGLHDGSRLVA
jgi:hypothetical protein